MDTIDPKVAEAWTLKDEVEEFKAQLSSWVCHYDELDRKFDKLIDALYQIWGLEDHEIEYCKLIARDVLKEVGGWAMSDDLVKDLRFWNGGIDSDKRMRKAAGRIEQLEAALRRIANVTECWKDSLVSQVNEIAHDALEGKKDD